MSSYDSRTSAQINIDSLIQKYSIRAKDIKKSRGLYDDPDELEKQINLIVSDLKELKIKYDKACIKGGK